VTENHRIWHCIFDAVIRLHGPWMVICFLRLGRTASRLAGTGRRFTSCRIQKPVLPRHYCPSGFIPDCTGLSEPP